MTTGSMLGGAKGLEEQVCARVDVYRILCVPPLRCIAHRYTVCYTVSQTSVGRVCPCVMCAPTGASSRPCYVRA